MIGTNVTRVWPVTFAQILLSFKCISGRQIQYPKILGEYGLISKSMREKLTFYNIHIQCMRNHLTKISSMKEDINPECRDNERPAKPVAENHSSPWQV